MTQLTPMSVLVQRLREASHVERSHTMPHHGSYTVGQHSFDMLTLLLMLYPDCRRELMLAVMFHDVAERWTGDVPHTAKESDGEFGKRLAIVEARVMKALGLVIDLTEMERFWLKGLDVVEYLLWCKDQLAMGNQNVMASFGATMSWLQHNKIPVPLAQFVGEHQWTRTPDQFPG
jgi:hypothetical protein